MKCPKCGYISFDNNVVCPKCSKDISDQMKKLNLPTYKTNTPSMLGSLIGETGEEKPKAPMDDQTQEQEQKPEITPGDSQPAEEHEISFDDDGSIDLDTTFDSEEESIETLDMPDFDSYPEDTGIQEDVPAIDLSLDDDDGLTLSLDELVSSDDEDTAAKDDAGDTLEFDDLDSDIDLNLEDEKSPGDETTAAIEISGDEEDLSLESLDLDLDETDEDKSS